MPRNFVISITSMNYNNTIGEYEDKLESVIAQTYEKKEILRNGLVVCLK